jgi:hypothetical protein
MTAEKPQSPILNLIFGGKTPLRDDTACVLERVVTYCQDDETHKLSTKLLKFRLSDIDDLANEMNVAVCADLEEVIAELERDELRLHDHYLEKIDGADLNLTSIYSQDEITVSDTKYLLSMEDGRSHILLLIRGGSPSNKDLLRVKPCVYEVLGEDPMPAKPPASLFRPAPPQ